MSNGYSLKKDEFIEKYNQLKSQHFTEKEIADKMFIGKHTLYLHKKKYGIPIITKENKELINENGLTREWLNIAQRNGLTSSMVNARIREYQWSVEDACTIPVLPKGKKIMKKGEKINATSKQR
jgi:orotate phosphoribosyltransferase-like protein